MKNVLMTGLAAGAAFGAFADFEIDLDLGEKPIRDARTSTCGPMVGYAGLKAVYVHCTELTGILC